MRLRSLLLTIGIVAVLATAFSKDPMPASKGKGEEINIPFTKAVLANGLTVIIHEDHKAPIVALNVWYHVGSKNEKLGKSGFAHLYEHLMFNGSENSNDDYFQGMERIGATDLNGTTSEDRTNYFECVPTSGVDLALWMESDRMGHLLGVIDKARVDEQRGVVQNEKRQGENEPYAVSEELIIKSTYPYGHPYSWSVIGSMDDLNAASIDDVKDWFRTYYGAANATLVVAGDITTATALEKVKKYFGDIPAGPPVTHQNVWIAKRTGTQRQQVQDRVPQARVYEVWNVPQWGSADAHYLRLAASILGSGKTSRLYKRLVYEDQIATDVSVFLDDREIGGQFYIMATAKPDGDLQKVEQEIGEELEKFLADGPTEKELRRVQTQYRASFIRGIERIGGFGGKSDILAQNQVFGGSPDFFRTTLSRIAGASAKDVVGAAKRWLSDGLYELEITPYPPFATTATDTTVRKHAPLVGTTPDATFPPLKRATLSNGMKILLAERPSIPVVNFDMLFDAGYASDQFAMPGTANLAMNMLDEGTTTRNSLAISEELSLLGATLNTGSNLDMSSVNCSALTSNIDASLNLFADIILHPSFPEKDFDRLQKQTLAQIQREKVEPFSMGLRILPSFIYGGGHAYGTSLTGSGTDESVKKMSRTDIVKFYQTWLKPNNATLVVVGATTLNEIMPKLESLFKDWKAGDVPKKNIGHVDLPTKPVVYLIDKPGALQSVIFAAHVAPPKNDVDDIAITAMNTALGGEFTSRINMNLREAKHWSYGAGSALIPARGQRAFIAYGPVQTDKTKESMVEINKELRQVLDTKPLSADELSKIQSGMVLRLPGSWETINAVNGSIASMVQFELPDNYFESYQQQIHSLNLTAVNNAAKKVVHPDNLVWVIVGDRSKVEAGIRELNYGEFHVIDDKSM